MLFCCIVYNVGQVYCDIIVSIHFHYYGDSLLHVSGHIRHDVTHVDGPWQTAFVGNDCPVTADYVEYM